MATHIKTIVDNDGNTILPRTRSAAVTMADGSLNLDDQIEALKTEKADKADTYTKTDTDTALALKADKTSTYTKTEVDTKDATKADKLMATNLIPNGSVLNFTNYGNGFAEKNFDLIQGRKYYLRRVYDAKGGTFLVPTSGSIRSLVAPTIVLLDGDIPSRVYTMTEPSRLGKQLTFYGNNPASPSEFRNVVMIDLTATFGAGNEPTKEQMDALLAKYPNSWFDGTTDLVSVNDLMNQKASKVQEAWITPTLVNGWSSVSNHTIQYMKDDFGNVKFRGRATGGLSNSHICSMPVGYRVAQPITQPVCVSTGIISRAYMNLSNGPFLYVSEAWISLDSISYKAGA